ncbi:MULTISPECIES: segregation and condensation protein B [Neobacillus]|uniref:segregation and condensation protein B n=1 Tax=Neobacillus TaxID=2675232 RepID=UPI0013D62BB6|nr:MULTISPECIES: segregation and condensation protein B [Neobacillus]MED3623263.1 segregation and condensation protein B [Neobacillus thermocopriae]MED3714374.1 segregation and condensation protein B [Neobacillus thermocopriae]
MFEVEGIVYTLKFNAKKLKTIEMLAKTSVVGEMVKNNGVLPYNLLELLFSFGLVEEKTNEAVPQKKAAEMFEKVVEENGYLITNNAVLEKFQADMGFMFR